MAELRDLFATVVFVVISAVFIIVPPLNETPLRAVLGFILVLFVPGYVFVSALFPGRDELNGIERLALSIGLSICIVIFIGIALNYTPWGITGRNQYFSQFLPSRWPLLRFVLIDGSKLRPGAKLCSSQSMQRESSRFDSGKGSFGEAEDICPIMVNQIIAIIGKAHVHHGINLIVFGKRRYISRPGD